MPRPTCQINLTLTVPQAEKVEEISFAGHKPPSRAARDLLLERMELVDAGWQMDDRETFEAIVAFLKSRTPRQE